MLGDGQCPEPTFVELSDGAMSLDHRKEATKEEDWPRERKWGEMHVEVSQFGKKAARNQDSDRDWLLISYWLLKSRYCAGGPALAPGRPETLECHSEADRAHLPRLLQDL